MSAPTLTARRISTIQGTEAEGRRMAVGVLTLTYEATPADLETARNNPNMRVVTRDGVQYIEEDFGFRSGGARLGETLPRPGGHERRNDILPGLADDDRVPGSDATATYRVGSPQAPSNLTVGYGDNAGDRWLMALSPGNGQTGRDGLLIHPDGGGNGTAGCIGIMEENGDARRFRERMQQLQGREGVGLPKTLTVVPAEVDNARAAEIARGAVFSPERRQRYSPESQAELDRLERERREAAAYRDQHPDEVGPGFFEIMLQLLMIMVGAEEDGNRGNPIDITGDLRDRSFLRDIVLHRATAGLQFDEAGILGQIDADNNQSITYGELMTRFDTDRDGRIDGAAEIDNLRAALQLSNEVQLDTSGDGALSLEEIRSGLEDVAEATPAPERQPDRTR